MVGDGTFELHPSLVVLRGWWIDSCKVSKDNKFIEISLNDDYFDYIDLYSDLIDSPLTLPIYDHFIVPSSCENIHGVISHYKHDTEFEKLLIYIDIENSSPLMYFNNADFSISSMGLIDLSKNRNNGRRLLKSLSFDKSVSLSLPTFNEEINVEYNNVEIAQCTPDISPDISLNVGFRLKYWYRDFVPHLTWISSTIGVLASIDSSIECIFGKDADTDDRKINVKIFEEEYEFGEFNGVIGPIVITVSPFVGIGASIERPALGVTLSGESSIDTSFIVTAGWENGEGLFSTVETSFDNVEFSFDEAVFPGKNGRLESTFSIDISPGLNFGLNGRDFFYIKAPVQLPYIECSLLYDFNCGVGSTDIGVELDIEFGFSVTAEFGIYGFELFGFKTFEELNWSPKEALYSKTLGDSLSIDFGCQSEDDIDTLSLFENTNDYALTYYADYPFVLINSPTNMNFRQANEYCIRNFDSNLATFSTNSRFNDFVEFYTNVCGSGAIINCDYAFVGLNNYGVNRGGYYNWLNDHSELDIGMYDDPSFYLHDFLCDDTSNITRNCQCTVFYNAQHGFVINCDTYSSSDFFCDLNPIHHHDGVVNKSISVYTYNSYYNWEEANNYCKENFGTELVTISGFNENIFVYESLQHILSNEEQQINFDRAWIGINNIVDEYNFTWQDGRDGRDTGLTLWYPGTPNNYFGIEECGEMRFDLSYFWNDMLCDDLKNAFVCNNANMFSIFEYGSIIGVISNEYAISWSDASLFCYDAFDSALASFSSLSDMTTIVDDLLNYGLNEDSNLWNNDKAWYGYIGLHLFDVTDTSSWSWVDDESDTTFFNWADGQPEDYSENHHSCVMLKLQDNEYKWYSTHCHSSYNYLFFCNKEKSVYEYGDYIGINTHDDVHGSYTWEEANNYCIDNYGTTLASVHSESQNLDMLEIFSEIQGRHTWIGMYNETSNIETEFLWIDGTEVDYTNWITGSPNDWQQISTCGELHYQFGGKWTDRWCDYEATSFICNKPISEIATQNFIGVNLHNIDKYSWSDANNYCLNNHGGTLASALNGVDYNLEHSVIWQFFGEKNTWIGLRDIDNSGDEYTWINKNNDRDNEYIADYFKWDTSNNEPRNNDNTNNCVLMGGNDGLWYSVACNNENNYTSAFICNKNTTKYLLGRYIGFNTHNNYLSSFTYDDANNYCLHNYGTTLATNFTDSSVEYNDILSIFDIIKTYYSDNINIESCWIGLNDMNTEGTYTWIDDNSIASIDSSYWYPGQPNNFGGNQDCVNIILESNEYGLNDASCDSSFTDNSFICNSNDYVIRHGEYIAVFYKYTYPDEGVGWDLGEDYCSRNFGTHLASINSYEDWNQITYIYDKLRTIQSELRDEFGDNYPSGLLEDPMVWIGLKNNAWIDGTPILEENEYQISLSSSLVDHSLQVPWNCVMLWNDTSSNGLEYFKYPCHPLEIPVQLSSFICNAA